MIEMIDMNFDFSQFFGVFFEEVEELFVDMEWLLFNFDVVNFFFDDLNVIFCCVYFIKGGVVIFGFMYMMEFMYVVELILDCVCNGILQLCENMVDVFLEMKDVLKS